MTPQQSQIHDDLQRKHTKLQAAIDQQQAELRVVSEQLLIAKLGMLQQHHPQPPVDIYMLFIQMLFTICCLYTF